MENISLYVRIRVKIKLAVVSQLCFIEVSAVYMLILGEEKERQIWSLVSA